MLAGAEWRAHDVSRRDVKVLVTVDRVVHQQMAGEYFAKDTLALVTRPRNRFE